MGLSKTIWAEPAEFIAQRHPDRPVLLFAPGVLQDTARRFIDGFPGDVRYGVEGDAAEVVIDNLAAVGVRHFSVASTAGMRLVRRLVPTAVLHDAAPMRTRAGIAEAVALGVTSFAVANRRDLALLRAVVPPAGVEICLRLRQTVSVSGGAPDAQAKTAAALLGQIAAAGFSVALGFGPGSVDATDWEGQIQTARDIASAAGVRIARLILDLGCPHRAASDARPDMAAVFSRIAQATAAAFPDQRPALICALGRATVADAFVLAAPVATLRAPARGGVQGGDDAPIPGLWSGAATSRIEVLTPDGVRRTAPLQDCLPALPGQGVEPVTGNLRPASDLADDDYLLVRGPWAGCSAASQRLDRFGPIGVETVLTLR